MLYSFLIAISNFILIEIFATTYYFLYFIALLISLYIFNFKIKTYQVVLFILCLYIAFNFLEEYIFEFFLYFNIFNYYIYLEQQTAIVLSAIHIILLKYVSYYFDLKKMGYNLVKK